MIKKIALIYDEPNSSSFFTDEAKAADEQKKTTKNAIKEVLLKKYQVLEVPNNEEILFTLSKGNFDFAFPLNTGVRGESRQSQVPAILEMLGIPYVGSGILAHALALNKAVAKKIFTYHDVSTPNFEIFYTEEDIPSSTNLKFPVIIKPACEGSGFGIHKDSVVYDMKSFRERVEFLLKHYHPPVLVEEFIEGREFTVGVIGNGKDKKILPIMEINFDKIPEEYGKFYTFEVKSRLGEITEYICPAKISPELHSLIEKNVLKAYDAIGCKDLARVDVRVKDNMPYILEINSLPGLKPIYSDLPKMALKAGLSYEEFIFQILDAAIKRYNCRN